MLLGQRVDLGMERGDFIFYFRIILFVMLLLLVQLVDAELLVGAGALGGFDLRLARIDILLKAQYIQPQLLELVGVFLTLLRHFVARAGDGLDLELGRFDIGVKADHILLRKLTGGFRLGNLLGAACELAVDLLQIAAHARELAQAGVVLGVQAHLVVLGVGQIGAGTEQIRLDLGILAFRFGQLFGGALRLGAQLSRLLAELVDLALSRQQTRVLRAGTAGKGAARIDDLTVKGDDLEAVAVLLRNRRCRGEILGDDDPSQEIGEDVGIFGLGGAKL